MKKLITLGIALAMLATMILPATVFAAGSDDGTVLVNGSITSNYLVTVGTGKTITLTRGSETSVALDNIVTYTSESETTVTINVKDADITNPGYMMTASDVSLGVPLKIAGGTLSKTDLTGSDQPLVTDGSLSSGSYTLSGVTVYQTTSQVDDAGEYSITLTVTAVFN
jgi:hypothetical protein